MLAAKPSSCPWEFEQCLGRRVTLRLATPVSPAADTPVSGPGDATDIERDHQPPPVKHLLTIPTRLCSLIKHAVDPPCCVVVLALFGGLVLLQLE